MRSAVRAALMGGSLREISFVGSGSGTVGTSDATFNFSSLLDASGATPSLQQGDLVVVSIGYKSTANYDRTPTGYTAAYSNIYVNSPTNDANLKTSYRMMGPAPDSSVTIPAANGAANGSFVVHVFRGVHTVFPMDATPTTDGAVGSGTNPPDGPAITPLTRGSWIYAAGTVARLSGAAVGGNAPNLSAVANHFATAAATQAVTEAGIKTDWPGGSFNPDAFTGAGAGTSGAWAAATLALRPARN